MCLKQSQTGISSRDNICHRNLQRKTKHPVLDILKETLFKRIYKSLSDVCSYMTTYSSTQIWVGVFFWGGWKYFYFRKKGL